MKMNLIILAILSAITEPAIAGVWDASCNSPTANPSWYNQTSTGTDSDGNPTFSCSGNDNDGTGATWTLIGIVSNQQINVVCVGGSPSQAFVPKSFTINCENGNVTVGPTFVENSGGGDTQATMSTSINFEVGNFAGDNWVNVSNMLCDQTWAQNQDSWPTVTVSGSCGANSISWSGAAVSSVATRGPRPMHSIFYNDHRKPLTSKAYKPESSFRF